MRIAFIAGSLGIGGSEKQLCYMARALVGAGCEIEVVGLTEGEYYVDPLRRLGCGVRSLGNANPAIRIPRLMACLRPFRPHVVQAAHSFANLYAVLAGAGLSALSVGALRCDVDYCRRENGRWTPWLLRCPDVLAVNSQHAAAAAVRRFGLNPKRVQWLPNCVDIQAFPFRRALSSGAVCAWVGRLIPEKRIDVFLRALRLARDREPSVRGLVIGDGPERERVRSLISQLQLEGHVDLAGSRHDVSRYLESAALLVLSSESEGSPNVLLEAMAAGLPVITTPAGDASTLVRNGVNGYLVPFSDAEAIARRICELAAAPSLRQVLGLAGRSEAERTYSLETLADRLFSLYSSVASPRCHRRTWQALAGVRRLGGLAAASTTI